MSGNLEVALILKARDEATRAVGRSLDELARKSTQSGKAMTAAMRDSQRIGRAREVLGIRSERMIQREIRQTEAAYRRLAKSGTASQRELARAADATRQRVQQLNREMMGGTGEARPGLMRRGMSAGGKFLQGYAMVGGAAAIGGHMIAQPMGRTMAWDTRVAHMANTAYAGKSLDERRAGKSALEGYVKDAVRHGGGSADAAADALDSLIASGVVEPEAAGKMLPKIMAASTAGNADPTQIAGIVQAAIQNGKISPDDADKVLGKALLAGQLGGFELRDMAAHLPKMLAMYSASGGYGLEGLDSILAASQLAVTAAGSPDQAGTNMVNLLNKLNSADTAKRLSKLHYDEKTGTIRDSKKGESGIDLAGSLAAGREKGQDSIQVFTGLLDKIVKGDKQYQVLQSKLAATSDDSEKQTLYESMASILRARGISEAIVDQQALLGLMPILNNPEKYADLRKQLAGAGGQTVQENLALLQEQAGYKFEKLQNEKGFAEIEAFRGMSGIVGEVSEKLADYAQQYPNLTAAVVGATQVLNALAATAAVASFASLATKGGAAAGALGGVGTASIATGGKLTALGVASNLAGIALAGMAGYIVGTLINDIQDAVLTRVNGKETTLGGAVYDYTHGDGEANTSKLLDKMINPILPGFGVIRQTLLGDPAARNQPSAVAPIPQIGGAVAANATQGMQQLLPQLTTIATNTDNAPIVSGLDQVTGAINQLLGKPDVTQITSTFNLPGVGIIAQHVGTYLGNQQKRG